MKRISMVLALILLAAGLWSLDTSTWESYSSSEMGFSLSYPGDWGEFVLDEEVWSISNEAIPIPLSITVMSTELDEDDPDDVEITEGFEEVIEGIKEELEMTGLASYTILRNEDTTIEGRMTKAFDLEMSLMGMFSMRMSNYMIADGDRILSLNFTCNSVDYEANKEIFEEVVNSLRFN